tara:strand:- start:72 stop:8645 length:8574 start_codon:yes stop_codon:yes gene_type:complete
MVYYHGLRTGVNQAKPKGQPMQPDWWDKILNPTLGVVQQPLWRLWRALKEDDVDVLSKEGILDPALLPVLGMFFDHSNDVMPDYMAGQIFGEDKRDNFGAQFATSLLTDPLSFLTSGLKASAKGGRALAQALGGVADGGKGLKGNTSVFHRAAHYGAKRFEDAKAPKLGLAAEDNIYANTTLRQLNEGISNALSNHKFMSETGEQLGETLTTEEMRALADLQKQMLGIGDDFLDDSLGKLRGEAKKREMGLGLPIVGDFMGMYKTVSPEFQAKHGGWMNWYFKNLRGFYSKPAKITMSVVDPVLENFIPPLHRASMKTKSMFKDFGKGWTEGALSNVIIKYLKNGEGHLLTSDEFRKLDTPEADKLANLAYINSPTGVISLHDHRVPITKHVETLAEQLEEQAISEGTDLMNVIINRFGKAGADMLGLDDSVLPILAKQSSGVKDAFKDSLTDLLQKREWKVLDNDSFTIDLDLARSTVNSRYYEWGRRAKEFKTKLFDNDQGIAGAEALRTFSNTLESASSQQTEVITKRLFEKMGELAKATGKPEELLNQLIAAGLTLGVDRRELMAHFNYLDKSDLPLQYWFEGFEEFFGGRINSEIQFLTAVISQGLESMPELQKTLDALTVPVVKVSDEILESATEADAVLLAKLNRGLNIDPARKQFLMEKYNLSETSVPFTEAYTPGIEFENLELVNPRHKTDAVTIMPSNAHPTEMTFGSLIKYGEGSLQNTPLISVPAEDLFSEKGILESISEAVEDLQKQFNTRASISKTDEPPGYTGAYAYLMDNADTWDDQQEIIDILRADKKALANLKVDKFNKAEYGTIAEESLDRSKLIPTYTKTVNRIGRNSFTGEAVDLENIAQHFGDEVQDVQDLMSVYSRIQYRQAALRHYVKLQGDSSRVYGMQKSIPPAFIEQHMNDVEILGGMLRSALVKPLSVATDGSHTNAAKEMFDLVDEIRNMSLSAAKDYDVVDGLLPLGYLQRATSGEEFRVIQAALADIADDVPALRGTVSAKLANTRMRRSYSIEDLNHLNRELRTHAKDNPRVAKVLERIDEQARIMTGSPDLKAYTVDPLAAIAAHVSEVQEAINQRKWFEFIAKEGDKFGITSMRVLDVVLREEDLIEVPTKAPATKTKLVTEIGPPPPKFVTEDIDTGTYQYGGLKVQFVDEIEGATAGRFGEDGVIKIAKSHAVLNKNLKALKALGEDGKLPMSAPYEDGSRAVHNPAMIAAIKTEADYMDFVLGHELAHNVITRAKGETMGSWETRVTNFALDRMGIKGTLDTSANKLLRGLKLKEGEKALFDNLVPENFWVGDGHLYKEGATEARKLIKSLYDSDKINESGAVMLREVFRHNPQAFQGAEKIVNTTTTILEGKLGQSEFVNNFLGALAGVTMKGMASVDDMITARTALIDEIGESKFIDWAMKNFNVENTVAAAAMKDTDTFLSMVASSALTGFGKAEMTKMGLGKFFDDFKKYFKQMFEKIIRTFSVNGRKNNYFDTNTHKKLANQLKGMVLGSMQLQPSLRISNRARRGVNEFIGGSYRNQFEAILRKNAEELGLSKGHKHYIETSIIPRRKALIEALDSFRVMGHLGIKGMKQIKDFLNRQVGVPQFHAQELQFIQGLENPTRWSVRDTLEADLTDFLSGKGDLESYIETTWGVSKTYVEDGKTFPVHTSPTNIEILKEQIAKATGKTLSDEEIREAVKASKTGKLPSLRPFEGASQSELDQVHELIDSNIDPGAFRIGDSATGPVEAKGIDNLLDYLSDLGVEGLPSSVEVAERMRIYDAALDSSKGILDEHINVSYLNNRKTIPVGEWIEYVDETGKTKRHWLPKHLSSEISRDSKGNIIYRDLPKEDQAYIRDVIEPAQKRAKFLASNVVDAAKERAAYIKELEAKVEKARVAYVDKLADDYVKEVRSQLDAQIKMGNNLLKMLDKEPKMASRMDMFDFLTDAKIPTHDWRRILRRIDMDLSDKEIRELQKTLSSNAGNKLEDLVDATEGRLMFDEMEKSRVATNNMIKVVDALVEQSNDLRTWIKEGNISSNLDWRSADDFAFAATDRAIRIGNMIRLAKSAKHGFTKRKVLKEGFLGKGEQEVFDQGREVLSDLRNMEPTDMKAPLDAGPHDGPAGGVRAIGVPKEYMHDEFEELLEVARTRSIKEMEERYLNNPLIPDAQALKLREVFEEQFDAKNFSKDVPKYSLNENGWTLPEGFEYLNRPAPDRPITAGEAFDIPPSMRGPEPPTGPMPMPKSHTYFAAVPEERVAKHIPFYVKGEVNGKIVHIPSEQFEHAGMSISSIGSGKTMGEAVRSRVGVASRMSMSGKEVTAQSLLPYKGHQVTVGPEGFNNAMNQQMKYEVPSNWAAGIKFYDQIHTLTKMLATTLRLPLDFHFTQLVNMFPQGLLEYIGPVSMLQGTTATARLLSKDAYNVMGLDKMSALMQSGKVGDAARKQPYPAVIGGNLQEMISVAQGRAGRIDVGEARGVEAVHEDMVFRAGDASYTYDDIFRALIEEGALDTLVRKDMVRIKNADEQVEHIRKMFMPGSKPGEKGAKALDWTLRTSELSELFVRMSAMHGALISGMDLRTAAQSVSRAMVNYSDVTSWERNVAKRIGFFYTFPRKIIPKSLEHMLNNPAQGSALINAFIKSSDEDVKTSEGRFEMAIGDYRVNIGRMDPRLDAIAALGSVADTLMPALGSAITTDEGFLKGSGYPKRTTGEAAPDKPFGPSAILNVGGFTEFFATEDPLASKSDWVTELSRSTWAMKAIMGDPILGSKDPNVEYSPLELVARGILPFRKVRPAQEEQQMVRRIKAHRRRYERELTDAREDGNETTIRVLEETLDTMNNRIKELEKVIKKAEKEKRKQEWRQNNQ